MQMQQHPCPSDGYNNKLLLFIIHFNNTISNIFDTDINEDSGSDEEEMNITQDDILQLSPVTQCHQSPTISRSQKSTNKRKNLKVTKLLDKRSKERAELMMQLIANRNTDEYDEVDNFSKTLALNVKNLPPQLISLTKLKMLTIVTDLELQAADNHTHNVHNIPSSSRVPLQSNNSISSSSPYSNNFTPYSSSSYSSIQQKFGPTNTTTFTQWRHLGGEGQGVHLPLSDFKSSPMGRCSVFAI